MHGANKQSAGKWRTTKGRTITEADALKLASEFESSELDLSQAEIAFPRKVGRPSLSGSSEGSPQVSFRISNETRERALKTASEKGTTVSALAREALEEYLRSVS